MIAIDTPEGIEHYRLCAHISRLHIEIQTSLSSKLSTLKSAQTLYGVKSRTRKGALEELLALYKETYGHEYGTR